jgi:hypothetical protein
LIALVVALAVITTTACWKRDEAESVTPAATPTPIDLNRDDMAALPGAEVDLPLLDQFPHYLRQESALTAEQIFTYYDEFFGARGWSVEVVNDPLARENSRTHRYSLGDELAFVKVVDRGGGRNEVFLSRRQLRDDERPGYEENEDN